MSGGHHPPQRSGGGRGGGKSPFPPGATPPPLLYRPPSPYGPSPPPRLLGSPMSPMFGAPGGPSPRPGMMPYMPCPRPRWPVGPPPHAPTPPPGPRPFRIPHHGPSPSPVPMMQRCPSPEFYFAGVSPYAEAHPHAIGSPQRDYEYVGVPLEPPGPRATPMMMHHVMHAIDGDEPIDGMSTADIIAMQSQEYVDEKLAEYQATIQQLQDEQERVQKKTFVNWINSYLSKRVPPLRVDDLIDDLKDGTKLLALLEVLSGEKLPVERGRNLRRPHFLSNANTALQFLANKRIKLVNINASDLVDGRPPVVLGLIWTIILYFQIEENSRALEYLGHGFGSASSLESAGSTSSAQKDKWKQGARKTLLQWVTNALPKDLGVEVKDFGASWRDGVAFLAIIDAIKANLINLAELRAQATNRVRLETAFDVAETELGIARLLDPEDVDVPKPDEKSIMTYVAQFLHKYPEPKSTGPDAVAATQQEYRELNEWLLKKTQHLEHLQQTNSLPLDYNEFVSFKNEVDQKFIIYDRLRSLLESQGMISITLQSWQELERLWQKLESQLRYWLWLLDSRLPGDFGQIGKWLAEAEKLLHSDDIPTVMNEETASIISKKLEQHKAFFADLPDVQAKFQQACATPLAQEVPKEQLNNMGARLNAVGPKAAQRRIRLKFLEHKCCLIAFLQLTETKLKGWTVKYGRVEKVVQLLEQYRNFVSRNKIFQEFNKAYIDMQAVVEEYKRDGFIDQRECVSIDRFMRDTADRWKHVSMELRCVQSMLEEVVAYWKRWDSLAGDFDTWLDKAENSLTLPEEERMEFFQDISVWKDKYQLLGDTVSFLIATCDDQVALELKEHYIKMTARWEKLFASVKHYMHAGDILRNRKDYRLGLEALSQWLRNAEEVLGPQQLTSTERIKAYGEQLQKLQDEIEGIEELFKNISKTFQTLIQDLSRDEVDKNMHTLKKEKEALVRVRALIPMQIRLFHQLLVQQESLEQGQREINQWLDEAELLLSSLSMAGGKDAVQSQLDKHKAFFSRTLYYKSMLESKNKVFNNIIKSIGNNASIDTSEGHKRMKELNERFAYVSQSAHSWEQKLQEAIRCWHNFRECERVISDWLSKAEQLIAEKHIDTKQTVEMHKNFFERVNERWIYDLVQTGQDLQKCLPTDQQGPVVKSIERLQSKWKEVLSFAPLHLMRLEFRLDETTFIQYLKDIEKEINAEQQAFDKQDNVDAILQRNKDFFVSKGTVLEVEKCLSNLGKISQTYTQIHPEDKHLLESHAKCVEQWENMAVRIENVRQKLQQIPAQWQNYHEKFGAMVQWMDLVDSTLKNILNEINTMEEFEKEKAVFQRVCREADSKREDMKWLVQTLDALSSHCTEPEAISEQQKLEALITRYKNLIPTIEVTMIRTDVYSKCYTYRKEVREVCTLLQKVKDQSNVKIQPDSLEGVTKLIHQQEQAVTQLDQQRANIVSMLQRGKDLLKDTNAPQFVQEEVKTLESGWNEAFSQTADTLKKLKGTQKIWANYAEQKDEILRLLQKAEQELKRIQPGQHNSSNLAADLQAKQEMSIGLRQATEDMLMKLRDLCKNLMAVAAPDKKPLLQKEVTEIEKRLSVTLETVQERVVYLQQFSAKWTRFQSRLGDLQQWTLQNAPALVAALQSEDMTPDERVAKSTDLQQQLAEKIAVLDALGNEAVDLLSDDAENLEAQKLKVDVHTLQDKVNALNRTIEVQSTAVNKDLVNWKQYQSGLHEIKPWIEQAEVKVTMGMPKPVSLQEAVQLQQQAKVFEKQCEEQLNKLQGVSSLSQQMTCRTSAPDELDAVHSRWTVVKNTATQWANKLDKLVANWETFDKNANKMETWINEGEVQIAKHSVNLNTPQVEKLESELSKLKAFNNEISEQQAKLISLTQNSDNISHALSMEGSNAVKGRVTDMKARVTLLAEAVRARINDVSDTILARQEFQGKLVEFTNWMDQLRANAGQIEEVSIDRVDASLQAVHALLQEHSDKQPLFNSIYDEVKVLTLQSTPDEAKILNETYTVLIGNYQQLDNSLQQKKAAFEKWSDLLSFHGDSTQQLNHIKYHIESHKPKPEDLERFVSEVDTVLAKIETWKQAVPSVDSVSEVQIRDKAGKPFSAATLVRELEVKAVNLKSQLALKMDVLQKVGTHWNQFQTLHKEFSNGLVSIQDSLYALVGKVDNCDRLEQAIKDIGSLIEIHHSSQVLKDKLHQEGNQLMKEDHENLSEVQRALSDIDVNWEKVDEILNQERQKYSEMLFAWKEFQEAKNKVESEINKAENLSEIIEIPNDLTQATIGHEKVKKALDLLKKAKISLDKMDSKQEQIYKQAESLPTFISKAQTESQQARQHWQVAFDAVTKKVQNFESQVIIWKQIEDAKNELLSWLSEMSEGLTNATENLSDFETGQARLAKYKDELPAHANLKQSILSKSAQLIKLNNNARISTLDSLNKLLEDEFADVKAVAAKLETVTSSFGEQEREIRNDIKQTANTVSKLREAIIKCEDLSGENTKILERLKKCQVLKEELKGCSGIIGVIETKVNEMKTKYPAFSESHVPKEFGILHKRYNGVLIHANKIEAALLTFLKKFHNDKYSALQRVITTQREKIVWCAPESGSDRYNLEVKLASLADIETALNDCDSRMAELSQSLGLLENVESPEIIKQLTTDRDQLISELENLKIDYLKTKELLHHNIQLWQKYEQMSETVSGWLKDAEAKVRSETVTQLDIGSIGDKIGEVKKFQDQVSNYQAEIKDLTKLGDALIKESPESRAGQYVTHLNNRYVAIVKYISGYLERLETLDKNKDLYKTNVKNVEQWLSNAEKKVNSFTSLTAAGAKPDEKALDQLKQFAEERDKGQELLNAAVDAGEALFSGITPENRENIRTELRKLRDASEALIDRVNEIYKRIETILLQRSSIEESFVQVERWIVDSQVKLGDKLQLDATLPEKKATLHSYRTQAQEVSLHRNNLKQLEEKIAPLSDSESSNKLSSNLDNYNKLLETINDRVATAEKRVSNHEAYQQVLEKSRDWLNALTSEAVLVIEETQLKKEGADAKLSIVDNLLQQKSEGDKIIESVNGQLQTVLKETAIAGHPVLLNGFEELKKAWESFLTLCVDAQKKLNEMCSQWVEFENTVDELEAWVRQKEAQVRDQSLRSTMEAKQSHLDKLRSLEEEIRSKKESFTKAHEQSQAVESESELSTRVAKLITRYHTLKNNAKEAISRYELFVKEHKAFNDNYATFVGWLSEQEKELLQLSQIVGDLTVLQDRQRKIRDILDLKNKESIKFEALIDQGEKLYAHTSPDGREIIRQQLRNLRTIWDSFSEDLQSALNKLDHCLLQFAEFTGSQEQLTKWLRDVERAMQQHTELKSMLQEKRAQLQNHKIMHQEIMAHQQLVESVCDKAQQLVDQTQDKSLNIYLQSIKQLFHNIVLKSKDLLDNLDSCVENHNKFMTQCANFKDWLNGEAEKLAECDDVSGEKTDITKRLATLEVLRANQKQGYGLLDALTELYHSVEKSTAPKGNEILQKDLVELRASLKTHLTEIDNVAAKQEAALAQWKEFETELDEKTKWFRKIEAEFRDQQLKATLPEKEAQLKLYKNRRDIVTGKEKEIDDFVDRSHGLLHSSGVERIKPLISQISNRYQLLHVLSKEVINRWQGLVDEHNSYNEKFKATETWLKPLEEHLTVLHKEEATDNLEAKANRLQVLLSEKEQGEKRVTSLTSLGERLFPDTAAPGREKIRQDLRNIRERWDKLEEGIKEQQKRQDAQTLQWSSYQEILQQTLAWLDTMEKSLQLDPTAWTSIQEIRSKLFKYKATLQEILSHKRIIESVTEKAQAVVQLTNRPEDVKEVQETVQSINKRYGSLVQNTQKVIAQLEESLDIYQQFTDLYKSHQDYQKQMWDRLAGYTDYSGNKQMLQARLTKVIEIQDSLPEGNLKLKVLTDHINTRTNKIPARVKEVMERDLANLKFDFEKFTNALSDVKHNIEERLQQWSDYEGSFDRLLAWLTDAETTLKNYAPRSTLEEKQEQLEKYQSLILSLRQNESEFDKMSDDSSDLVQSSGDTRISVNVQQITSRFQSIQSTAKEIVKKCEQAVGEHEAFNDKYKQCSEWIAAAQARFEKCRDSSGLGARNELVKRLEGLRELMEQQPNATALLHSTVELGEKLYPSTALEGRETIRQQLQELQQALETLYDGISSTERELQAKLSRWSGFEECAENIRRWLKEAELQLPQEPELKTTLDEKRAQLQIYRALLHDALAHQQDIIDLRDKVESLPERNESIDKQLLSLTEQHAAILKRAQYLVERCEAIVSDHQKYSKAVMDASEWLDATNHTVAIWGDTDLERISLHTNLERIKNLQISLPEEESRITQIRVLGEKVIPGTIESGQVNIRNQIDSSQQEWESLLSTIQSTIEALDNKLQAWNEYEILKDQCSTWIRETDTKLHAVDLKATCQEKKDQLELLKNLQGEVRAKELEIDTVTERAQQLHKGAVSSRSSLISEIGLKYQQVSHKVKDLTSRWQQYVTSHQEFDAQLAENMQWLEDIKNKLSYCTNLSATSEKDLEGKLELIQDLLLYKEEGFGKIQSTVELAQIVLANTAPAGHDAINQALAKLQEEWSILASKMIETKSILDDSISKWSGFLEQIQALKRTVEWMENSLAEISEFQTTMTEKRAQLERIKNIEEKVRCEKIEVDNLKAKAAEMLASGQQSLAASQAQEVLNKFDKIAEKIKSLLTDREDQYKDHRLYKEAHDELMSWLTRARDKMPSMKQRSLSDKLAVENVVAPLEALLNKQAQGELLVEHLQHTGEVACASTSPTGQETIRNEIRALRESFEGLFKEIRQQKEQLEGTVLIWRDFKDEYERLCDWLQQVEILIKNQKLTLLATVQEKEKQVADVKGILKQLEDGKEQIDKFNESASILLKSHLDTYVNNQLRHLNSRYQVQVNLAKDVLKKVETNLEQHQQYNENYLKAKAWIDNAKEIIHNCAEGSSTSSKDVLLARLGQIQDLLHKREEGQNLVHTTVNCGEKVLRNTRSDGKDVINNQLKEIQSEWDRLVRKISTAKVHLETSLLQWADYSSSYTQLQQWITDREAKLQQVTEQKVVKTKKGQVGLSSLAIGERKANLRQTNSIVQDIVSFEPMIQSVASKAEDLMQGAPASEISTKYETLSKQAKELYEKQKETVEQHQAFIDAGNEFSQWIRAAKEKLSKCSEPTGDKESLSSKSSLLKVLQNELPEGQAKLEKALELADTACSNADDEDKDIIEEEVAILQEEYDNYVESLNNTKTLLEQGIVKWTEYEDQYQEASDWLTQTEALVQSYNKLQDSLEEKRTVLEQFQIQLQTLFDWQKELDRLNMKAQILLETCADTRISNAVTQMTTKYNALLSLAKEIMRRLELHYQEHQQHNALYQECQDWIDRTRDKLNECQDVPNTLTEVHNKLHTVKGIRHSLEQGQNKLRYALELKEKVIMNTEQAGAAKIQEDTENLKQDMEKLLVDVQDVRQRLTSRAQQLEEINKSHKLLVDWLKEMEQKVHPEESVLNDLSEKKSTLEKFKSVQREILSHGELVEKLKSKLAEDKTLPADEFEDSLRRYEELKNLVTKNITSLEQQVKEHEQYKQAYLDTFDWVRRTRIDIQQCSDSHGEKQQTVEKEQKISEIAETMPEGEKLVRHAIELSASVMKMTGSEGQDTIKQEIQQLKQDWEGLQVICKETQKLLNKCVASWKDYEDTYNKMKSWVDKYQKIVDDEIKSDKKTPEELEKCRKLLAEVIAQKVVMEDVNDRCEALMELSACSWVRDQTVQLQSAYTNLLTAVQGLVSRVEKNLSDHTEFLKAKKELEQWLFTAHGSVQDCIGVGDEANTKDKLETIRLVATRMTEGQHLLSLLNDAFTKAINTTPADKQESLREDMTTLRNSWEQLTIDIQSVLAQLKAALTRWEDFNESKARFEKWIKNVEESLKEKPDTKGELGEMKTLQERYKHLEDEIVNKKTDLDRLLSESSELAKWAKRPAVFDDIKVLQARYEKLSAGCNSRKEQLDLEMQEYNAYYQSLQDTEKWLLQISFQLMAHNSLYITNREQTQEQINQHESLLNDIQKYQTTLDDVKAKGHGQIDRYVLTTPGIKPIIEKQLSNVQDSYNSLLHTAVQIKNRLTESLAKFQEYEDTLESIMNNLDSYEPQLIELDVPVQSLDEANQQLEIARSLHNKLQTEKSRLALAVQACEAATACISRPSSPQDPTPAPIPQQELMVRSRLEDFIDQVQSRLSGIQSTVGELEEQQKQRKLLQDWITQQRAAVVDWKSRPAKLRPEAAKQELSGFTELLTTINEHRNRLLTELPLGVEGEPDLETDLNNLEELLLEAIASKQSGQGIIEDYRGKVQDIHGWFDSLVKRMEALDKGSGLNCSQKQAAIVEIKTEFEDQGPVKLNDVKKLASDVIDVVSNLDSQQVEEQLKSVERRYNDITKRIQRKMQVLEMTRKGIEGARDEIDQAREWIRERTIEMQRPALLGFESRIAEDKQQGLKALLKETEGKKVFQETLEKRINNMTNELEPTEQSQLESALRSFGNEREELILMIKSEIDKSNMAVNTRKRFESDLEKAHAWLKSKSNDVRKLGGYLPLRAATVELEINQHRALESDIKEFSDGDLNDLLKQGSSLLKECTDTEREKLQKLLNAVSLEFDTLKNESQSKIAALSDLLQGRKQFEADIDRCQRWLNEAEVATSGDIRASSVELLEEQLTKYDKLSNEAAKIADDIEKITEQGKAILPTVSEADKLTLSEQLNSMKDKHARISAIIRDRTAALRDSIKQYKDAAAKIADSVQFMTDVQKELKDLNKPVGSKVEDVQSMLAAYEKILGEVKANKAKLGDLSAGNVGEFQGIIGQQDDLIKAIEDQIAKLKQLLLLREQFIALITEIMTFITKYTEIVRDIEKSGQTVEEKIKRYDDVIFKIQECEAMLASASDKGQQIAADCTAADRNAITEQLQSLKQSLQTLRRAVEKQREQHQITLAEHRKLGAELEEIIDWLHANEAAVKSRPLLNRDIESVEKEIQNHHELANNVNKYLDRIRQVQDAVKHDDGLPSTLLEQLSEANSLLQTLPGELEERRKYLDTNKQLRADYLALTEKLYAWVKEAEMRLQSGKEGVDFENILSDLEEHKIFFSSENSMKELVSQKIQQAADKIWPSLSGNEQEELSREQQHHTQLLKNTMNSAKSRRAQLEQDAEIWKDYCQTVDKVKSMLARTQFSDEPVSTLAGLHFNIQKITHALNDIQNQQFEVDLLNERALEIVKQADSSNRERIDREAANISGEWASLVAGLENRRDVLSGLASRWEEFEQLWQQFESSVTGCDEKSKHIDTTVRSQPTIVDVRTTLQELVNEAESLKSQHEDVVSKSATITGFLHECSEQSATALSSKLHQLTETYSKLISSLKEKENKVKFEVDYINTALDRIKNLHNDLTALQIEVVNLYVFGENTDLTEKELNALKSKANSSIDNAKKFISDTRQRYIETQQLVPSDISQQLSNLELLSETIVNAMDEKDREFKRAKTVRSDYLNDVDQVQSWIQKVELKVQDRSIEPQQLKEYLQNIQSELGNIQDRLEKLIKNGKIIIEKTKDDEEKVLVQSTIDTLTEQLQQVKSMIEERKQTVGDTLDAWQRFLTLYEAVMIWVKEKREFMVEPLQLSTLQQARQRLHDYSNAVKTCKGVTKNLSDMGKELEHIGSVTNVGDLPAKLEEAETAKVDVETNLLERNALLSETSEEWEQCEKKMKDVKGWIEKSRTTLESPQNKKRPLRDQLAIREKMLADATIQKTKISLSVEKLQVHFRSGIGGDTKITDAAQDIIKELDILHAEIRDQCTNFEQCLAQLDQYQQEVQNLRQQVVQVEQQLRTTLAPTYAPHDRDKAHQDQQACKERVRALQAKIAARNERMKLLAQRGTPDSDPFDT